MALIGYDVRKEGLNSLAPTKLYKQIVIPSMLFGCELLGSLINYLTLTLERAHCFGIKIIMQGLRRATRSDTCRSLIRLAKLSACIDRCKLKFMRVLCL